MGLRIFLVEDNPIIRENLSDSLEELAHARPVASAASADEATAWLSANGLSWDMLVVDLFLEKGSGLDVLAVCKDRRQEQRAVVLSNYATPIIRERCLSMGADAVFDKSSELEEFMRYTLNDAQVRQGIRRV